MAQYSYEGVDSLNNRVSGFIQGQNEIEVLSKLTNDGITPIKINKVNKSILLFSSKNKITRKDLITFTYQLYQLLSAGVPLMSVLESVAESSDKKVVKDLVTEMIDDMRNGSTLSQALEKNKNIFGPVYISLVQVGEQTGGLDKIFNDLAEMLKWEDELASKAKKIMIYPTIVITVVMGVVITLMVFLVPQLLSFIKEMGGELSFATRSLLYTSEFVQKYLIEILLFPIFLIFLLKFIRNKSKDFKKWTDCKLFNIPLIGEILYKLKLARLANSISIMYSSGMPFIDSISLAKKVVNNDYLEEKIDYAHNLIQHGSLINESFKKANVFPPMAIHMLKAGEESGRMDDAMQSISYFFDRDAKELIEKIEPAIEPVLTVILAMIVLWIMMAILAPVYDTISKIQF